MAGYTYKLPAPDALVLSGSAARALLQEASGSAALLYIYILTGHTAPEPAQAAKDLRMTLSEAEAAAGTLVRLGLLEQAAPVEAPVRPAPADELPEYSAEEIKRELDNGTTFKGLLSGVQDMLGKILSADELQRLFGLYDALGLPAEVLLQLVAYSVQEYQRRYGPGRRPTLRQIEKLAYIWEKEGIFTLELAERYIRAQQEKRTKQGEFALALRICDRALSTTEASYVQNWLDLGFGPEAADIAFDKTVTATGKLDWKYMNGIFKSWHAKGLHTAEAIRKGDGRAAGTRPYRRGKPAVPAANAATLDDMRALLDEINNG